LNNTLNRIRRTTLSRKNSDISRSREEMYEKPNENIRNILKFQKGCIISALIFLK
jgi:hypothetical protein